MKLRDLHYYCPNIFESNFTLKVSRKNIFTVESSKATATNFELGDIFTHMTASSSFNVLVCNSDNTFAFDSLFSSTINSNCQNFTVLSLLPVAQPL